MSAVFLGGHSFLDPEDGERPWGLALATVLLLAVGLIGWASCR